MREWVGEGGSSAVGECVREGGLVVLVERVG